MKSAIKIIRQGKGIRSVPRRECCVLRRVVGKGLTEKMAFEQRLAEAIQIYILID